LDNSLKPIFNKLTPYERGKIMKLNKTLIVLTAVFFILSAVKIFSQTVLNENSIKFENVQTATLVGQDGTIMRTEDGGLNWAAQVSGITNVLNSNEYVEYADENGVAIKLQIAVGENGIILKSVDNGLTWNLKTSGTIENLNDVVVFTPNMIFVCGNNGLLLRSVDFGETWSPVTLTTANALNHIEVLGPITTEAKMCAIIVGDSGTAFGSVNMEDWTPVILPVVENILAVEYIENTIICAGENGTILKSINNGTSWVVVPSGITTKIFDLKFINSLIVIGSS
jgi:photosystem II stability/assembly factor-like uncharacterized protein